MGTGTQHPGRSSSSPKIRLIFYLLWPFASTLVSTGWHAEILALATLSIYGHLRHTHVPPSYLIQASWSPLSSFNRASRVALVQLPPPLLIDTDTSSPSASLVIRLIPSIGCDHTGGENRRRSSSAGYLEIYHKRIHFSTHLFPDLIHTCVFLFEVTIFISSCYYLDICE